MAGLRCGAAFTSGGAAAPPSHCAKLLRVNLDEPVETARLDLRMVHVMPVATTRHRRNHVSR
jgi:hypothetical protein